MTVEFISGIIIASVLAGIALTGIVLIINDNIKECKENNKNVEK